MKQHLLQAPFEAFVKRLGNQKCCRSYIDTFLRYSPRSVNRILKRQDGLQQLYSRSAGDSDSSVDDEKHNGVNVLLHKRIFNVFRRLVDDAEINNNLCDLFTSRETYGAYLYDNWVVSAPQILDFCSIFATSQALLPEIRRIVRALLELQPAYAVDLSETIVSISSVMLQLVERIGAAKNAPAGALPSSQINDWVAYLLDILFTLWNFGRVCPDLLTKNVLKGNFLQYMNTIVRSCCPLLISWNGPRKAVAMVTLLCVALGADKPVPRTDRTRHAPSANADRKKHVAKKPRAARKAGGQEDAIDAAYRAVLEKYANVEDDDDDYISGAFSLERDGPEILEQTSSGGIDVAIVRDMDGKKQEIVIPNANRTVRAPASTRRKTGHGKGAPRGRGRGRGGGRGGRGGSGGRGGG